MNIVIVTREEFPYGGAASNRLLTYLPGIVAKGHNVTILCLFLSNPENVRLLDSNAECVFEGIRIKYVGGNKPWPTNSRKYITKALLMYKSRRRSKLFLEKNRDNIDIVQMYSTDIKLFERYGKICRTLGLKYAIERSELPDIVKDKERFANSAIGQKYIARSEKAFGLFDGWILETQTLVDYYSKFFARNTKYVIVPMTVDSERFTVEKQVNSQLGKYIAYCGNMGEADGVSILIEAYSIFRRRHSEIKLVLAGDSKEVPTQKQLAKDLGIDDDVVFLGRLNRDEVPQFLANAMILALASPTSERASASMPCKVGEYLCTTNPVVVTGQGEIFKYLQDGVSAYLAKPDSAEAFAAKLEEVVADMSKAKMVGEEGRKVAITNFSSEAQITRIEQFYKDLLEDKN